MDFALLACGAIGHAIAWVAVVNRLHGRAMNRNLMHALTALCGIAFVATPMMIAVLLLPGMGQIEHPQTRQALLQTAAWGYVIVAALVGLAAILHRLWHLLHPERHGVLISNHTTPVVLHCSPTEPLAAPGLTALVASIPGNEVFSLQVHEKTVVLRELDPYWNGLRIVHLSDLHMSGRITQFYFSQLALSVNNLQPDLVCITGDIIERQPCIDWIPQTLGRLVAPAGVFYVLGNHDKKVNVQRLHEALSSAGLIHVGGRAVAVDVRGSSVIVAGNELPWFGPAPQVESEIESGPQIAARFGNPVQHSKKPRPLRLLLAHTPDQFDWAQEHEFDLMLAGHNHGGQVCLPLLGAVLCPSHHGVRYSSGLFQRNRTVMHVSCGSASLTPVRYNCPPEIALLNIQAPQEGA